MVKARRSSRPWRGIPTFRPSTVWLMLVDQRGEDAVDTRKPQLVKQPGEQPPAMPSEPDPPADPPPVDAVTNPYDGVYEPPAKTAERLEWLACPHRHVHGLSSPVNDFRGSRGGRIIALAHDVMGSGLIGKVTMSVNQLGVNAYAEHDCQTASGWWDNAMRQFEDKRCF